MVETVIKNINEYTLGDLQKELINVYAMLDHNIDANPNSNCEILLKVLSDAKNIHMPKIIRKFNKRKDKKEDWMTNGLLAQINRKK